ncbi:hypothetical protein FRC02_003331 [Tulasnella sp. 418]|nr:hypothetical protein FRC02_003331 [Tulasnella sp. 418]
MTAREHGGFPDCAAFFAILSSCPSLERLVMSGGKKWKDACARSLQAEKQEIRLPRLKSLSLEYLHPVIIGTLLSSIIFIAFPDFLLDVIANPSLWHTDPRLESILPPFDSNNIGVLPQNIQSLQWLDIDYLVGGGRLVAYGGKWNGTHPDTTMRIDMLEAEDPLPALLRTILLPDLAQFTSLTLNGTALFADDLIANHLRYLQRLERLHITDAKEDAVHGIFSALTPSRLSPQHQLLWPCPNLRKLRLHDALFQIERLLDMIEARQGREVRNIRSSSGTLGTWAERNS